MKIRLNIDKSTTYLGVYLLFFAFFFLQYPINQALTGITDSWFYVAHFKLYENYVLNMFSHFAFGESLYPNGPGFMYGDPCFFGALIYRPFCWLGMNELWAWASMMVVVYGTNAFGAYLFFSNWTQKYLTAFWAGLAFGASTFCFGNIDSPNAFYLGTMFFCLHYSNLFLAGGRWKHLMLAVVWGASTLYFSAYVFVFQALLLVFLWAYQYRKVLGVENIVIKLLGAACAIGLLIVPYLMFLFVPGGISDAWNPVATYHVVDILSLNLSDLARPLEGNLIYPPLKDGLYAHPFFYPQHAVFPGILFIVLAVLGYRASPSRSRIWLVLAIIGFIMAIGPAIRVWGLRIPMPMSLLYEYAGLDSAIRTPVRLWYLVLIALIGLTLPFIDKLLDRPRGAWILLLLCTVYLLENVPFAAKKYDATAYVQPDHQFIELLAAQKEAVVLELPSAVYTRDEWPRGLNEFSREYIYMLWQTKHRQNLLNGCNGFLPVTRLTLDDLICRMVHDNTFAQLQQMYKVDFVVFHKNLPLLVDDVRLEGYLQAHPLLTKQLETAATTIYSTKPLP